MGWVLQCVKGLAFTSIVCTLLRGELLSIVLLPLALFSGPSTLGCLHSEILTLVVAYDVLLGFNATVRGLIMAYAVVHVIRRTPLRRVSFFHVILVLLLLFEAFQMMLPLLRRWNRHRASLSPLLPSESTLVVSMAAFAALMMVLSVVLLLLWIAEKQKYSSALRRVEQQSSAASRAADQLAALRKKAADAEREKKELQKKKKQLQLDIDGNLLRSMPLDQLSSLQQKAIALVSRIQEAQEDYRLCKVCLDAESCVLLLPCKHLCLCESCVASLRSCPLCRQPVQDSAVLRYS
mmetsp:Transcript_2193/g.7882  ORF Transcript_2193/g.7882 Transcript_2193/m.7882 type:complete len:293 (+) Transcript_2193:52-930(+)